MTLIRFAAMLALAGSVRAAEPAIPPGMAPPPLPALRTALPPLTDATGAPVSPDRLWPPARPAVIAFWASWCAPCVAEMRALSAARWRGRVSVVGVNIDATPDGQARAARILARESPAYPMVRAVPAAVHAATGETGDVRLPRSIFYAADGRPVAAFGRFFGQRTLAAMDAAGARIAAEKP